MLLNGRGCAFWGAAGRARKSVRQSEAPEIQAAEHAGIHEALGGSINASVATDWQNRGPLSPFA